MGTVAFALNDVAVKTVGRTIDALELAFFRYVTGFVLLTPFFIRLGVDGLKTGKLHLHAIRLVLAGLAQIGVFISVINMLLASGHGAIVLARPFYTDRLGSASIRAIP